MAHTQVRPGDQEDETAAGAGHRVSGGRGAVGMKADGGGRACSVRSAWRAGASVLEGSQRCGRGRQGTPVRWAGGQECSRLGENVACVPVQAPELTVPRIPLSSSVNCTQILKNPQRHLAKIPVLPGVPRAVLQAAAGTPPVEQAVLLALFPCGSETDEVTALGGE